MLQDDQSQVKLIVVLLFRLYKLNVKCALNKAGFVFEHTQQNGVRKYDFRCKRELSFVFSRYSIFIRFQKKFNVVNSIVRNCYTQKL